jgi:hypothetical protein
MGKWRIVAISGLAAMLLLKELITGFQQFDHGHAPAYGVALEFAFEVRFDFKIQRFEIGLVWGCRPCRGRLFSGLFGCRCAI